MASRDELLILARLKNEVSRPIQEIRGDLGKLERELASVEKVTGAQVRQLRSLGREAKASAAASKELGERWAENGKRLTAFLSLPIALGLGAAAKAQSALAEATSKANVVFGAQARSIHALAETAARDLGLSKRAVLDAAGTFGALFTPLGIGQLRTVEMSDALVRLSADIASFNNVDTAEVLTNLRAGLVGEAEPLRRFGVQLSAARIEQVAYSEGIAQTGKELTAGQKALAAYRIILADTAVQQGDFARTADGAANSVRQAQASIENSAATIGEKLTPAVAKGAQMAAGLAEAFAGLPSPVQTAIVAMLGVAAAAGPILFVAGKLKALIATMRLAELAGGRWGAAVLRGASLAVRGLGLLAAPAAGFLAGRSIRHSDTQRFVDRLLGDEDLSTRAGMAAARSELYREWQRLNAQGEGAGLDIPGGRRLFLSGGAARRSERLSALTKQIALLDDETAKLTKSEKNLNAELGNTGPMRGIVRLTGELADQTDLAAKAMERYSAGWDRALGRFLDADDAAIAAKRALDALAESLRDPESTSTDRAERAIAAVRGIEASVQADAAAGRIAGGAIALYQAQVDRLRAVRAEYPALSAQIDGYIAKLQEAQRTEVTNRLGLDAQPALDELARVRSLVAAQRFEATLAVRLGPGGPLITTDIGNVLSSLGSGGRLAPPSRAFTVLGTPIGDTARPRGGDGASLPVLSALGTTMGAAGRADALVPGRRLVTSGLRDYALGSPRSDHLTGRALDVVGANLGAYAEAIRAGGGFAEFHGGGRARHLHVVPSVQAPPTPLVRLGPSVPPPPPPAAAGVTIVHEAPTTVSITTGPVSSSVDLERAVARGMARAERDRRERRTRGR